ncbi:MAG: hypothetical protein E6R11_01030 [Rhodocyclaceae bacterium]|jgi:membrane-bound inhibitor of C-type lysozyme|nr:MAG: hypothetical protein E6R11_01030 [Rhodocyclaceae bacterium]
MNTPTRAAGQAAQCATLTAASFAALLTGCGSIGAPRSAPPASQPSTPPSGPVAPVPQVSPPAPSLPPPTPKQMVDQYIRYRCENGFDFAVTYQGNGTRALVERSGYSDLLRLASAASGAKYSDGKLTLHAKGDGAVLELPGGPTYRQCRSLPAKPAPKK